MIAILFVLALLTWQHDTSACRYSVEPKFNDSLEIDGASARLTCHYKDLK